MPLVGARDAKTGAFTWHEVEQDNDDEVAAAADDLLASQYGDMLHDVARNDAYQAAIERAVQRAGGAPHVLDIGTGTGLLAMMAARAGARVTACETYKPMAAMARRVLEANGMAEKVKLHETRSTELFSVASQERADILVTEIFDTDLIGEGVLGTLHHALAHLVRANAVVIPASATVYVQLVHSAVLRCWQHVEEGNVLGKLRPCRGRQGLVDLHVDRLAEGLKPLSEAVAALHFDFANPPDPSVVHVHHTELQCVQAGRGDALIVWWELQLDEDNFISTAPPWIPTRGVPQWRDHWLQGIFLLPEPVHIADPGYILSLTAAHDDYSVWFQVPSACEPELERPSCTCGAHILWNTDRLWALNDIERTQRYLKPLCTSLQAIAPGTVALQVSDGGFLAMLAATHCPDLLCERRMITLETSTLAKKVLQERLTTMPGGAHVTVVQKLPAQLVAADLSGAKIALFCGEPFFYGSLQPWDKLFFWQARTAVAPLLSENAQILPQAASICGMLVEFEHLHKTVCPVGQAGGFSMAPFDAIFDHLEEVDLPKSVWEYAFKPLSAKFRLLDCDFRQPVYTIENVCPLVASGKGTANALIFWMDVHINGRETVSEAPFLDGRPSYRKQTVRLLRHGLPVDGPGGVGKLPSISGRYDAETGLVTILLVKSS